MPLSGAAAVRLYDDHVDSVHALLTRRVGHDHSPRLTAETFEYAMRAWDRFDSSKGTERLFLFRAAVAVLHRYDDEERTHLRSLGSPNTNSPNIADPLVGGASVVHRVVTHDANRDLLEPSSDATSKSGASDIEHSTDPVARTLAAVAELAPDDRDILLLSLWESCAQSEVAEVLDLSVNAVRSSLGRIRRDLKSATSGSRSGGMPRIGRRQG